MTRSVAQALILKDWRLHRTLILLSTIGGVLALALLQLRTEAAGLIGTVWFFVSVIVLGSMLPISNVINERKKQNLAFMMSLPVSSAQYAMAKMVSTIGIFLLPWAALLSAGITLIYSRSDIPEGLLPLLLILCGLTLVGFCLIAAVSLVTESEGATIAATIACNSTYGLSWYFIIRNPAINSVLKSPVPVWNSPIMSILLGEAAALVLILGVTCFLQSRKRNFV